VPRWFIVSALLLAFLPAATALLNHSAVRSAIIQRLKIETGMELSDIRVRLYPRLRIEFSDAVVRDGRQPNAFIQVRRGEITLRFLPLLRRQIAVVRVTAEGVHLVVWRDRSGRWFVPLIDESPQATTEPAADTFHMRLLLPELHLIDGDVTVIDEFERDTPRELKVRKVDLLLDSDLFRMQADLRLIGEVTTEGAPGALSLSGALSIVDLPDSPHSVSVPPLRFAGSLRLDGLEIAPWVDPVASTGRSWRTDVTAQVLILPGAAGYDLSLSQVEGRLDWLAVRGQGGLRGIGADHPGYAATFAVSPVRIETLLDRAPATVIFPHIRSMLVEYQLAGTLELVSGTLSGVIHQDARVDWKAVIKLSNGSGLVGTETDRMPVQELSSTLFLDPLRMEAMNVSAALGPLRVSNGKLVLSHLDVAPSADIQATVTGKTRDLIGLFRTFGGAGSGVAALDAIETPRGEMQVSLRAGGPLTPDPDIDLIKAEISGHDLHVRVPSWDLAAEHVEGSVVVRPGLIMLNHVRGIMGPIQFDALGTMEMGPVTRFEDVMLELSSEGAELKRFLSAKLGWTGDGDIMVAGPAKATVHMTGMAALPDWTGMVDLTQAELRFPPIVHKRRDVALRLEFEGTLVRGRRLNVRHLALVLPMARVDGQADIRLGAQPRVEARLHTGPLPVTRFADAFSIGPIIDGRLAASLAVTAKGPEWKFPDVSGSIEVTNGQIKVEGFQDRLREVRLRLQMSGGDAVLAPLSFKIGDSDLTVRGTIKHWATDPAVTLTVESTKLDVTRLISGDRDPEERARGLEQMKEWAISTRADIHATIGQAHYRRLAFRTLTGRLLVDGGRAELTQVAGRTRDGSVSGRATASLKPGQPIEVEGGLEISGVPVQQIVSLVDPEADPVKGSVTLAGEVRATVHLLSKSINRYESVGPVRLRIDNGRIVKGRVLPKVLQVLNLPALLKGRVDLEQEGFPFDHISASVDIVNGMLASKDIVLDSPIMKVTAAGQYHWIEDRLDLGLAVSPLGSYSDVLKGIPLFGRIWAGDRPGLDTALFEVTGSFTDPQVRYLPIESIAKGLTGFPILAIDVLRNTLALPGSLLTPSNRSAPAQPEPTDKSGQMQ
jgi:hypothetical protein